MRPLDAEHRGEQGEPHRHGQALHDVQRDGGGECDHPDHLRVIQKEF